MTRDPLTIGADASLQKAEALMRDREVRHLAVVGEAGELLGILTDRDLEHAAFVPALAGALAWEPRWLKAPRVRDVMTWSPVTTQSHIALAQAALIMFQHRIGSLPVVENGRLVGILTGRDGPGRLQAAVPGGGWRGLTRMSVVDPREEAAGRLPGMAIVWARPDRDMDGHALGALRDRAARLSLAGAEQAWGLKKRVVETRERRHVDPRADETGESGPVGSHASR